MRPVYLLVGMVATAAAAGALLVSQPGSSPATTNNSSKSAEAGKSATAQLLPITQVVLFSSGVGYFQREGQVEDSQRIDLSFDVRDINDLIKSMTLRDLDGGHIATVSYDSNAPLARTLKSFAINLTHNQIGRASCRERV